MSNYVLQQVTAAVLTKTAAKKGAKRKERKLPDAFPDYGRSLYSQTKGDPTTSGLLAGAGYGSLGAVLGALAARLGGAETKGTLAGGAAGGLLAGTVGYLSGSKEQESENSRLLFLRRLGINNPGELEAAEDYPELISRLTEKGRRI